MAPSRRSFLWFGSAAVASAVMGCGKRSTSTTPHTATASSPSTAPDPGKAELGTVKLVYADPEATVKAATSLLRLGHPVEIVFDGQTKVSQNSPLLALLGSCENMSEVWLEIDKYDTEDGRKTLAKIFDSQLLQHKKATNVGDLQGTKRASGEVIAPGIVILVILVVLISAGTATAITQIALDGPIRAHFEAKAGPFAAVIRFEPATVH